MPSNPTEATTSEPEEASRPRGRIRGVFSGSRDLVQLVYRDPEHVAERLTLLVTGESEAQRGAELLQAQGYGVVVSAILDDE